MLRSDALIKIFLHNNPLFIQFFRYIFTGGLAFVVDFGLFALCLRVFGLHYLIANLIGLNAGLVINYVISVKWVFAGCKRNFGDAKKIEFSIFSVIGILGVGFNQLLMLLLVGYGNFNEMLSKIVAAGIVLVYNFLARKFILFHKTGHE